MSIPGPDPKWTALVAADQQLNCVGISDDGRYIVTATSLYGSTGQFATYVYDATTPSQPKWVKPIDPDTDQLNGAFWASISGDGQVYASGGTLTESDGYIVSYMMSGPTLQPLQTTRGTVNQLELSGDGYDMVAVSTDQVSLSHKGSYTSLTLPGTLLFSCDISQDGQWIIVGSDQTTPGGPGAVTVLQNNAGQLEGVQTWTTPTGVLKVAMDDSGNWLAAGCRDGSVTLWVKEVGEMWSYQAPGLGRTYALSVLANTEEDKVSIVAGANVAEPGPDNQAYGKAYRVDLKPTQTGPEPDLVWEQTLEFAPNPGVHIDPGDNFVTALDGEPLLTTGSKTGHVQRNSETPGNFYLFDSKTGNLLWQRPTGLMNWGMAINRGATAIAGGSDTGVLYYWGAPSS